MARVRDARTTRAGSHAEVRHTKPVPARPVVCWGVNCWSVHSAVACWCEVNMWARQLLAPGGVLRD
eukprot:3262533-Prymnesium_polylepis.1